MRAPVHKSVFRVVQCGLLLAFAACGQPASSPEGGDILEVRAALTSGATKVNCGGPAVGSYAADVNFSGGATLTRTTAIDLGGVVNPAPMALYQSQRYNNMSYTFSGFAPGASNDVRLHFADTKWTTANQRLFNVTINGAAVLSNFDVIGAAGAPNKAVTRSFTVPASASGAYVIQFVGTKDAAMVSGIEIAPEILGAFIHVNAGGPSTGAFVADQNFTGGSTVTRSNSISVAGVTNPAPVAVYQSQRFGTMTYNFPGFVPGARHNIRLHFADTKYTTAGSRVFNVAVNGTPVLTSFDVVAAAGGGNKAVVEELQVAASATGSYSVAFAAVKDQPMISGIEIVPLCSSVSLSTAPAGATPTSKVRLQGAATCVAGVTPEYHFAFRDPASADDSWHAVAPSFGGPVLVWDTNWKSTTPMGSSYQLEVIARAVNNADSGETNAVGTVTLTSASQVGASGACTSSIACDDGVITTVDTCSAGHCGVEPGAHGTQTVPSYVLPPTAPTSTPLPPTSVVSINVGLALRAPVPMQTLQARVDAISDPKSPVYRQYLSASDLAAYLPTPADASTVVAWAQSNQLTAKVNPGTPTVSVSGTAQQLQKALYVHLVTGTRPDGTTFFGPDRAPSLDVSPGLLGVSGLDNYVLPKATYAGGTGPVLNTFDSSDLRSAYLGGPGSSCRALTGAGQSIGLVAFAGFNPDDISVFETNSGLTNVPAVQVILGGTSVPCPSGNFGCDGQQAYSYLTQDHVEINLDIQSAMSMAPGAQIVVFQTNTGGADDIFQKVIANPQIHQISSSWGIGLSAITPALLTIMAAQGQTFFDASGDSGNLDNATVNVSPTNPAGMCVATPGYVPPYTVMVGGTDLNMAAGQFSSEGIYGGSSGGVLPSMPIPPWQQGINPGNAQVSSLFRNIPDVSLPGQNVYFRATTCNGAFIGNPPSNIMDCQSGSEFCGLGRQDPATGNTPIVVIGCTAPAAKSIDLTGTGTSVAAPMWAGFMALINQSNAMKGLPPVGFANPSFYAIGKDAAQYAADFNDVRSGQAQAADCSKVGHTADVGYDLVTGLGSPTCALIGRLGNPVATLGITLTASGTANVAAPVTLTGTGVGFTPNDSVGFTLTGVPGGGGTVLPTAEVGDDVQTDANGNITFNLTPTFLPAAVLCSKAQESQLVTLTAHDRGSAAAGHEVTATTTFSASLFCAEIIAPRTDVNIGLRQTVLVRDTFPGHPAPMANDGDPATYWGSVDFDTQDFVTVDLAVPMLIHRVSVLWGATRFASTYDIQTSNDNSTWTSLHTFNITQGGQYDLSSLNVTARFVRLNMTVSSNFQIGGFSVPELQVFGQVAP